MSCSKAAYDIIIFGSNTMLSKQHEEKECMYSSGSTHRFKSKNYLSNPFCLTSFFFSVTGHLLNERRQIYFCSLIPPHIEKRGTKKKASKSALLPKPTTAHNWEKSTNRFKNLSNYT